VRRQISNFRPHEANKWFVCNVSRNEEAKFWSGRSEMGGAGVLGWGGVAKLGMRSQCGCESSV
jgi:hypothetical protein